MGDSNTDPTLVADASGSGTNEEGTNEDNANEEGTENPRVYYYPTSSNIEDIESYRPGGYHPITLGDTLNSHYTILHKLGYGGFSTVWLAQDTEKRKYVAIKVIMAESSEEAMKVEEKGMAKLGAESARYGDFVNFPTECFWIDGPNGVHLAIVSPFAGASLAQLIDATLFGEVKGEHVLDGKMAQRLALQITQAVSYFHSVGIGHGDLTVSNILLELQNLDHLAPEELLKLLGHSQVEVISRLDAKRVEPTAPKYAIEPADTLNLLPYWTGNIKIIDFGTLYFLNDPPETLGTPFSSCPPEFLVFDKVGKEADIWALGVLIYKIRAGKELFPEIIGGDWEVLSQMEEVLGTIPGQEGTTVALVDVHDEEMPSTETKVPLFSELVHGIHVGEPRADVEGNGNEAATGAIEEPHEGELDGSNIQDAEGVLRAVEQIVHLEQQEDEDEAKTQESERATVDARRTGVVVRDTFGPGRISREEADLLIDLLQGALNYDVEKRFSADEMLRHPWFSTIF